ncbi:MAG: hypothetical protein HYY43_00265 [Deltaproteobacteria bacterium]|nr:hypothetical protein [Deltaproteobacteria bacterium]MBI2974021.1 hypothetical protein [Deltaproteobacteria bacterium]
MRKKKAEKPKKHLRLRQRLSRLFKFSWVRFDEPMPKSKHEEEEITHWYRMF